MKHIHWLTACGLALGAPAWAQDNVTLYGAVDAMLNNVKGGSTSLTKMEEGGSAASRLGLKGSEDLGGGLRTNFVLEGGISLPSGQGTIPGPSFAFTRQSYLGLSGKWGSVDLGRMYTPTFYVLNRVDPFGMNALFSSFNLVAATDTQPKLTAYSSRANGVARYRTPSELPFKLDLAYGFDTTTVANSRPGDFAGLSIGWDQQPYYVAYAYQRTVDRTAAITTSTTQSLSGGFDISPDLRVAATYLINSSSVVSTPNAKIGQVGVAWNITPTSKLLASFARRKVDGSPRDQSTWTLGYDYNLSKRTAIYARWLQLTNGANAAVSIAKIPVAANSGDDGRSVGIGIRHTF